MSQTRIFLAACVLALVGAAAPAGGNGHPSWLPDPRLTSGAFAESSTAAICVRGYDRAHRVWHDKTGTLARYRIAPSDAARYEDDDLIPVCLGGDNASPLNHWPQPLGVVLNERASTSSAVRSSPLSRLAHSLRGVALVITELDFLLLKRYINVKWPQTQEGAPAR